MERIYVILLADGEKVTTCERVVSQIEKLAKLIRESDLQPSTDDKIEIDLRETDVSSLCMHAIVEFYELLNKTMTAPKTWLSIETNIQKLGEMAKATHYLEAGRACNQAIGLLYHSLNRESHATLVSYIEHDAALLDRYSVNQGSTRPFRYQYTREMLIRDIIALNVPRHCISVDARIPRYVNPISHGPLMTVIRCKDGNLFVRHSLTYRATTPAGVLSLAAGEQALYRDNSSCEIMVGKTHFVTLDSVNGSTRLFGQFDDGRMNFIGHDYSRGVKRNMILGTITDDMTLVFDGQRLFMSGAFPLFNWPPSTTSHSCVVTRPITRSGFIISIAVGFRHFLILTTMGLFGMGRSAHYQLGFLSDAPISQFTPMLTNQKVRLVWAHGYYSLVVTESNLLLFTGQLRNPDDSNAVTAHFTQFTQFAHSCEHIDLIHGDASRFVFSGANELWISNVNVVTGLLEFGRITETDQPIISLVCDTTEKFVLFATTHALYLWPFCASDNARLAAEFGGTNSLDAPFLLNNIPYSYETSKIKRTLEVPTTNETVKKSRLS